MVLTGWYIDIHSTVPIKNVVSSILELIKAMSMDQVELFEA